MEAKDFADMITLVRRAPLKDMNEAEAVSELLKKFAAHADAIIEQQKAAPEPALREVE